jgi:hypothetical protein
MLFSVGVVCMDGDTPAKSIAGPPVIDICGRAIVVRLVAREDGWFCPECDYRQYWAHEWMGNWKWSGMVRQMVKDGIINDDV